VRLVGAVVEILLWGVCLSAFGQTSQDEHRVVAETLLSEADALRVEYREELSRQAIEKYDLAAQNWLQALDREQAARAKQRIGAVQVELGDLERALESYREADQLSQEASSKPARSEILSDLGVVSALLGQDQQALDLCGGALSLARSVNHPVGEAKALNCFGEVHYQLGGLSASLDYYLQARAIWTRLGDHRGEAESALGLGYAYSDSSELDKAREQYQQALSEWEELEDKRGKALTLIALGRLHSRMGENQKALNFYNDAMTLLAPMGDKVWEASTASGIGHVYVRMNDYRMGLVYRRRALELFRAAGLRTAEMDSLLLVGETLLSSGDAQNALGHFGEALAICRELGNSRCESWSLGLIGTAHRSRGELEMALDHYQQALSKIPSGEDPRSEALTMGDIGDIHERKGDLGKAADLYTRAMTLSREAKDRFAEAHWLYRLARLERSRENLAAARQHMVETLEKVESLRSGVESKDLRSSYFASVHPYYELYIDVLMRLDRAHPEQHLVAAAFQASERARARSFLEMLTEARVDIRQGVDVDLLERERALKGRLDDRSDYHVQLLSRAASEEESNHVAAEIRQLTADLEQLQALIRSKSPRYAALTHPEPLSLEEIQREVLDDDTVLLEYSLGEKNSYLWAVSKTKYTSHVLPPGAEIETQARGLYELLTARQPSPGESTRDYRLRVKDADSRYWEQAARLSEILLGPVAEEIESKRLVVVSEGALLYLPFCALPVPRRTGGGGVVPLVAEHEVTWLPSASLLAVSRKEAAGREAAPKMLALFADPVFENDDPRLGASDARTPAPDQASDLTRALRDFGFVQDDVFRVPRLPGTLREAESILSLVPDGSSMKAIGFAASRSLAMSAELSQYRIVHFATHGLMNSDHAELSGILLSMVDENGRPQNGFLRLRDIYNLDLRADLVVLSACNTALGKEVRGEGVVGLARGFMYSGAKRVLASLWKVDDEATGELMKQVYQRMLAGNLSPAAALREAQVSMWREKQWSAPFYWSAFTLQGDWR
jgi:CHAT domain-containing protein/tetratricopeptide (TPR) repeat protein